MLGHCIVVGGKQGKRGKTQALVDGNGPLQPVTPALAMTGMPRLESSGFWPGMTLVDWVRSPDSSICPLYSSHCACQKIAVPELSQRAINAVFCLRTDWRTRNPAMQTRAVGQAMPSYAGRAPGRP